ncbi:MAG TPA: pitrilysin family protein [Solirubrobacteraceae bacterium]|jgi:predicted Zn-dependent peptidase|nr:pitrilysin family protein [Solirubrobacteraceae bacterium]
MPAITTITSASGLPVHRISIPGTRALTSLVAFDAGARSERPEENGIAHFLEHLIFKGGESYPTYRDVNETAERMGAVINAYTSHDIVAFHVTSRAEAAPAAIDLLSDIAGRPRIDPAELDRERGVVIQEIARADDQPAVLAAHLADRAANGEHPLGRPVLGPAEHLRSFSREEIVAFRDRRWSPGRGGAFLVGNTEHLPPDEQLSELFGRFPSLPEPDAWEPAPAFEPKTLVEQRDSNQSHLRMIYRIGAHSSTVRARAAIGIYSTLLGGSMGSRLFDEIREQRGLCYSVWAAEHTYADAATLNVGAGLESAKCAEAYARMRAIVDELRRDGPKEAEVERARAYSSGRLVLAFENSGAVARHAATNSIVYGEDIDSDAAIDAFDVVTFDEVAAVARSISEELAVACVGPHDAGEF